MVNDALIRRGGVERGRSNGEAGERERVVDVALVTPCLVGCLRCGELHAWQRAAGAAVAVAQGCGW